MRAQNPGVTICRSGAAQTDGAGRSQVANRDYVVPVVSPPKRISRINWINRGTIPARIDVKIVLRKPLIVYLPSSALSAVE